MAKTTTITSLSPALAQQVPGVVRRVMGGGGANVAITPYGEDGASGPLWFIPDSKSDSGANVSRWNYIGKLYKRPDGATPIGPTTFVGRNTYEARNTSTVRAGYTVTPASTTCGVITGIEGAPLGVAYKVEGRMQIGGVWVLLFTHRNDPIVRGL